MSLNVPQFEELIAMPLGPNGYDLTVMHPFRGARFNNSIATNGRYFAGPFTHFALNTATYLFTYHFFANCSAEFPDGYLDEETLKTFEGVTGERGSFKWAPGRERIPENVCESFALPIALLCPCLGIAATMSFPCFAHFADECL